MRWVWPWRRQRNGAAARAAAAEEQLRRVRKMTPAYDRLAGQLSVPADEFVVRVARAFRQGPA